MYTESQVIHAVDHHAVVLGVLAALALLGNLVWFIEVFRNTYRDRTYSLPAFCIMFWLANDSDYAVHYSTWFHHYRAWLPEVLWVGLTLTAACEVLFTWHIYRYGRDELAPRLSRVAWPWAFAGFVVAGFFSWYAVKHVLSDPLYIVTNGMAAVSLPLFGIPRMLRHGDTRGQSTLEWLAFTVATASWFVITAGLFGSGFRNWAWIGAGVVGVAGGLAGAYLIWRWGPTSAASEKDEVRGGQPAPRTQIFAP